jgi:hypothetical protein
VTVSGTGFTGATSVTFNGTTASFVEVSDLEITATVPAGATTGPIAVTTIAGTGTSAGSFTVVAAPVVTSFTPTSGPVGTDVTISGTGFTGATSVTFNGTTASFVEVSDLEITASVPAGATSGLIAVTTAGGTGTSTGTFTVVAAPVLTSFTPTSGPVGTGVTISGTGFTGATSVTFNGTSASFVEVSDVEITTTVPAGATTGPVFVTNPAGTGASAAHFTVIVPECSNGLDDDGDGLTDHPDDPGCADATDLSEHAPSLACDDGVDGDGDGSADFPSDPGCQSPTSSLENPKCQDGIDNEGDGKIDFDGGASVNGGIPLAPPDPHCPVAFRNSESKQGCGLGFEIALLLPPLLALRRRRERARSARGRADSLAPGPQA